MYIICRIESQQKLTIDKYILIKKYLYMFKHSSKFGFFQ